jgi:hypothetical protein
MINLAPGVRLALSTTVFEAAKQWRRARSSLVCRAAIKVAFETKVMLSLRVGRSITDVPLSAFYFFWLMTPPQKWGYPSQAKPSEKPLGEPDRFRTKNTLSSVRPIL